MSGRHLRWLYSELPKLIESGVLNEEEVERLRAHYASSKRTSMTQVAIVLCSVLGACLIGSGVILLLASNWDDLSRSVRTFISIAPLAAAQGLVGWALFRKNDSTAWREGSGALLTMAIGSSIALIGQTYHIPGNLASFLFTWLLLGLPALYLLRSTLIACFYMIGATIWVFEIQSRWGHALWYGPLLAGVLPFLWLALKNNPRRGGMLLLGWVFCLNLVITLGIVLERNMPGLWIVAYSGMFAVFALVGRTWYRETPGQPFSIVGATGTVIICIVFTFDDVWDRIGYRYYRYGYEYHEIAAYQDYLIVLGILSALTALCVYKVRRSDFSSLSWMGSPVLALLFFAGLSVTDTNELSVVAAGAFNLYLFALGVYTISSGLRREQLGVINGGMAILSLLFIVRFFDSDLGFVVRGIAFILIGSGFLTANLFMARKFRESEGESS